MAEYEITKSFSNQGTRNEVRMRVVDVFSREPAGSGKKDLASKFTYYVETLESGNRVYLRRPANLHNGFDFLVCVEGINYAAEGEKRRNYPKHHDIICDLKAKASESPEEYRRLFQLLEQVYLCNNVTVRNSDFSFTQGFPVDLIVKTVKWLFIEQDIRYWNYSGRDMLWGGIKEILP